MSAVIDSPRLVPPVTLPRDRATPLIIGVSLLLHALVLLPLLRRDRVEPMPIEIPVELVQVPAKAPDKAVAKPVEKPPMPPAKSPAKPAEPPKPQAKPAEPPKPRAKAAQTPKPQAKPAERPKPQAKAAPKPPAKPSERPARRAAKVPPPRPLPQFVPPAAQPPRPGMSTAERLEAMLGPMPAVALPGASADGSDAVSYSQLVLSQLAKAKKQGRYHGVPGHAGVAFSIGDNGEIVSLELVAPSGDPMLDEEALAMVKRAAPYPPPPPGGRRDYAFTLRFTAL